MPAILFKTATKQLHEGYKAARDRLSAGASSGSSSRPNSFSDRGGVSRTASFNSSSSTDINARDKFGRTKLHYAAKKGNVAEVKRLLAAGATVESKDNETALHFCSTHRSCSFIGRSRRQHQRCRR